MGFGEHLLPEDDSSLLHSHHLGVAFHLLEELLDGLVLFLAGAVLSVPVGVELEEVLEGFRDPRHVEKVIVLSDEGKVR